MEGFSVRYRATLRSTANRGGGFRSQFSVGTDSWMNPATPLTGPSVGSRSFHAVQLLGGQLHLAGLLLPTGALSGAGGSRRVGGRRGCGGGDGDGDLGFGRHSRLVDVPGGKVQVGDGLHELGLRLLQESVDVLSAELGQAGPLLLPVPLCCLDEGPELGCIKFTCITKPNKV